MFSTFSDGTGYGGFVPSSSWLCAIYDGFIEKHKDQIDQRCAMGTAEICSIDHSHKVSSICLDKHDTGVLSITIQITKQIAKVNSEPVFTAAITVTNEYGEICVLAFVATKSHSTFEPALEKMRDSLTLYGHLQPQIFYTDNPAADKHFLEHLFPSLTKEVMPIQKYPALKPFTLSPDISVTVHDSFAGISGACSCITDDLDVTDTSAHLAVGFDAEFNFITTRTRSSGGGPQPTSIIQVAYKNRVDIFQVISALIKCYSIF